MIQIVYISTARGDTRTERGNILMTSRRNNDRDGISGLLYDDGKRFLQVLEGEVGIVEAAFARIKTDPRHRAVVILSRREIEAREFGDWAMASLSPGVEANDVMVRVGRLVARASANVRATFESFAQVRAAA
ncbi:BLUF domain-containing protein [Sphingomonas sp. AX6]|uniref:BLUF domain-containing protein n=1 Tax=Sphingomonas sp. AX6 TaxID=2653171 RepID=UPI0012F349CC|nr:BLUF domain-containing protein [Sphingomonas sp. AX6]VXC75961.1 Activator of photopigment and puc with BLUF domain protein [Sphingomonas sp. AX6]